MSELRRAQLEKIKKNQQNNSNHDTSETPVATPVATPALTPAITPVPTPVGTGAQTPVPTPENLLETEALNYRGDSNSSTTMEMLRGATTIPASGGERQPYLDATHTASEKSVYSVMYRETVSKGIVERHFGFKELSIKTGIRSDRTIRIALKGLQAKMSVAVISYHHGNPLGPRYRVYEPKEIARRRKAAGIEIDPQSKKMSSSEISALDPTGASTGVPTGVPTGVKTYGGTPVEKTPVTPVDSTGVYKYINPDLSGRDSGKASSSNSYLKNDDDEAFAGLIVKLKEVARDVTGSDPSSADRDRWTDVADVLAAELRIVASRTTVSSAPALLAAHLSRRLRKSDARQIEREVTEASTSAKAEATASPKLQLSPEQIEEQVNLMAELLRDGRTLESLDEQFSGSFRAAQWHTIRSMALAQLKILPPKDDAVGIDDLGRIP
ncbi:MAG: hypothetical protein ACRD9R_05000 [Pyrinomonadaceae bacterium]